MNTEITEKNVTALDNFKQKLKLIDYSLLIDRYITMQNLIITGGIIVFFILLMSMIFIIRLSTNNIVEIEISKLERFEKSINDLRLQQETVHTNLVDLITTVQTFSKENESVVVNKNNQTSKDKLLPDLLEDEANDNSNLMKSTQGNINEIKPVKEKIILSMKDEFDSERVDLDWKNKYEVKIIDTLEKIKFEKTWFENLECRSSICELVVTHINKSDSDDFTINILTELNNFTAKIYSEENSGGKFRINLLLQEKKPKSEINIVSLDQNKPNKTNKRKIKKTALRIEDKFKQESIDNRWRKLIEFKIKTVLERRKFKKTWFDELLCKTSVCKLVVTHNKRSTSNAFIKEFPLTLGEFEKKKAKVKKGKNGNYKTTMYLQQRVEKTKKSGVKI